MKVDGRVSNQARTALAALADLAPSPKAPTDRDDMVSTEWFRWLGGGAWMLFAEITAPDPVLEAPGLVDVLLHGNQQTITPLYDLDRSFGERLAAVQQVREGRHAVRVGWLWVCGTTTVVGDDGRTRQQRVLHPLVTRNVRVMRSPAFTGWRLQAYGDIEITRLVTDRNEAWRLGSRVEFGGGAALTAEMLPRLVRLRRFADDVARAAGFGELELVVDRASPDDLAAHRGLRLVAGWAVFTTEEVERTSRAGSLLSWVGQRLETSTAFTSIYGGATDDVEALAPAADGELVESAGRVDGVLSPLPLTPAQAAIVRRARSAPVTVVSGAPGTGKSHTLVAIVCDAAARGDSVLVAVRGDAALDALVDLLARQPGIVPVVFGASEQRARLAERLLDGRVAPALPDDIRSARRVLDRAVERRRQMWTAASALYLPEWRAGGDLAAEAEQARGTVPSVGDPDDPRLRRLANAAISPGAGWWSRWRSSRTAVRLRRRVGAHPDTPIGDVTRAIEVLSAARAADEAQASTPGVEADDPAGAIAQLVEADDEVSRRFAKWLGLEVRSPLRLDRFGLAAVSALATALRSGRSARRTQLERMDDRALTRALPVWMGTLADVDDLLPPVPGLFDLVLVDEASSTEQSSAAPALLRASRAVVVGDPRQLRHTSFVGDEAMEEVFRRRSVPVGVRSQLDVRRNSVFDAAAAAAPVLALDEHFRSDPHLIEVVAERIYRGELRIATRTPITDQLDCVHLHQVAGRRNADGVVRAEIDRVLQVVERCRGQRSVGVISPFRAQADALEQAILASFGADALLAMKLRVGTVHSFQGNERDHIICSLGLSDDDPAGWSFVADPHLLAVMLTRARRTMTIVSSAHPQPNSLLGAYVAAADSPPGAPTPAAVLSPWGQSLADDLRRAGVVLDVSYSVGRHVVDIATESNFRPVAIITALHPHGVDAHLDRAVALVRGGWEVVDALPTLWGDDAAMRTADLARQLLGST